MSFWNACRTEVNSLLIGLTFEEINLSYKFQIKICNTVEKINFVHYRFITSTRQPKVHLAGFHFMISYVSRTASTEFFLNNFLYIIFVGLECGCHKSINQNNHRVYLICDLSVLSNKPKFTQ